MIDVGGHVPRVALVTGGGRWLGAAIVRALSGAGFAVAIHYRGGGHDDAESLAAAIPKAGGRAIALEADLADETAVSALVARAAAALGPVGVLINNAGMSERDEPEGASDASSHSHLEPNLRAPFVLIQQMARALPADAGGVAINMLDQRVWSQSQHCVSRTVSNSALWSLTRQLALALAPRIRVNAISPGPTLPTARRNAEQCASAPPQEGISPEEIGRAVLAVVSLPSMTGQMIALDDGQHRQRGAAARAGTK